MRKAPHTSSPKLQSNQEKYLKQTQTERNSTKYLTSPLQNWPDHQRQGLRHQRQGLRHVIAKGPRRRDSLGPQNAGMERGHSQENW